MKILVLDFSSPQRTVAVLTEEHAPDCEIADASPGRDMKPFALIDSVLRRAGLEREAIDCLAVGLGPGSYSGIRVAIAVAQGWQMATGVRLLGVSSVAAIATQAIADGLSGRFGVVIDAQRGEFYVAGYEAADGMGHETSALRLAARAEVEARERAGDLLIGPEITRWFPQGKQIFPRAARLARLAWSRTDFASGEKLEPIYLRETTFVKAPPARIVPP